MEINSTPTEKTIADFRAFNCGDAITGSLAALYEADGFVHGKRVLSNDEARLVFGYANTLPSTPANNVWD